jgi:rare lipoprotein A
VAVVPVKPTQIYIQAGAFVVADNAKKLKSRLDPLGAVKVLGARVNGVELYRVRLGPIPSVDEADRLLDRVVGAGLAEARIVVD